ncbi:unnamed protein product, partial [Ascophyllum nodosum]
VSVALWGCRDEHKVLQNMVATVLDHDRELLYGIWKQEYAYEGEEEQREWEMVINFTLKVGSPHFYVHILANCIRRPIIFIHDDHPRESDLSYIDSVKLRSRIYLPNLVKADKCCPTPLVIGYTNIKGLGHATALVGVHGHLTHLPIMDKDGIPFLLACGVRESWGKDVEAYMNIEKFHAANGRTYYLSVANESRMIADRALDIAGELKRKHENDETDDDDDNGETMWVQFR